MNRGERGLGVFVSNRKGTAINRPPFRPHVSDGVAPEAPDVFLHFGYLSLAEPKSRSLLSRELRVATTEVCELVISLEYSYSFLDWTRLGLGSLLSELL